MIRKVLVIVVCCVVCFTVFAQQAQSPVITLKQRFLKASHYEAAEEVDSTRKLHLMIAGNIYQTEKHVECAYDKEKGKYDFRDEFRYVQPILNLGDICIANLKTSFGDNVQNMFSSPDEFALALKYSGISAVMHANVHTANINKATLMRTRELLNKFDMFHTGAFTSNVERLGNFPLIINEKGFRIAILNYTRLAMRPSISYDFIINDADKFLIEQDMRRLKSSKADFVIVYFDWGVNEQDIPSTGQQDIARFAFEHGADLVVGTLPNNPMRLDYMSYYRNGVSKEGIVAYSLGNLVGSNQEIKHRNGYIIDMELRKNNYTGETKVGEWGVIPVYTYYDTAATGATKIYSLPCSAMENGEIFANATYIEKRRAVNSAYEVRQLLGSTAEEIQYKLSETIVDNVMQTIDITNSPLNNKFSPTRKDAIAPSAAPVLASSGADNNAPSLALLYKQEEKPVLAKEPEKKKETQFDKQKKLAERAFVNDEIVMEVKQTDGISATKVQAPAPVLEPVAGKTLKLVVDTVYRIQFYALNHILPIDTFYYTHLKGYDMYQEDGLYKYVVGWYKSYEECYKYWKSQMQPRYKQSTIIKYLNGKRILE